MAPRLVAGGGWAAAVASSAWGLDGLDDVWFLRGQFPTLSPDAAVQLRSELERLEIPEPLVRLAVMPHYEPIFVDDLDALNDEQREAIRTRIQFYDPSNFDEWEVTTFNEGIAPFLLTLSVLLGLLGALLYGFNRRLRCPECRAFLGTAWISTKGQGEGKSKAQSKAQSKVAEVDDLCEVCDAGRMQRAYSCRASRGIVLFGRALLVVGLLSVLVGASSLFCYAVWGWGFLRSLHINEVGELGLYFGGTLMLLVGAIVANRKAVLLCDSCGKVRLRR